MSANTQPRLDRAQTPAQSAVIARLQHGYAAHLLSEPLTVTRWLMYGQARLYVKTQQGNPIGWVDVHTGERVIEVPELQAAFETAIAAVQPGIPMAYTPRRALLESVESGRRPNGDEPTPRRTVVEEVPEWTPVARPTTSAKPRSTRAPRTRTSTSPASQSTDSALPRLDMGRLDALTDRYRLWRGTTERQVLTRQLNAFISREPDWDYLSSDDLGIDNAAVDFLVAGPGGVFTIDVITPTSPAFRGAGFTKRASHVLGRAMESPVWVRHLLVPVGFSPAEAAALPTELPLISRRQLAGFLLRQPTQLQPGDVELALGYARLRWTWRG
ncbi:hypothetical protein ATK74_1677 [Propionicimonas paludicola]|uniref:Uncharacterized protein n=1 Tax=Propionicimonas paludicola TaxID=185243 RepID=A0A2A9CSL0_9ACTN|nr:hypothetical protein [Propionicimonas paludicola]PFG17116.1 hypothetical protein ATK74_1677 [Propionicimonas paludicola]